MFCIDHLHTLRNFEIGLFAEVLPKDGRMLEIGGGTGIQAQALTRQGFNVVSIDIPTSNYADQKVFDVQPYDGTHIPFPDASFDVVFSSNTLEHVPHLDELEAEIRRVLRPGGYCVHALPSGAWRFWTSLAHYVEMCQRVLLALFKSQRPWRHRLQECAGIAKHYAKPPRHGERGTVWSEVYYFSRGWWLRHFQRNKFVILEAKPMGLFYSGHMVLGKRGGLGWRRWFAPLLGSACVLYRVRPQ